MDNIVSYHTTILSNFIQLEKVIDLSLCSAVFSWTLSII